MALYIPVILIGKVMRGQLNSKNNKREKNRFGRPKKWSKSTILNRLIPHAQAETGDISQKSGRGKHTTRHTELFTISEREGTMIFDTPGFTSFDIMEADEYELQNFYWHCRFAGCKYGDCRHLSEPGCVSEKPRRRQDKPANLQIITENQLEEIADSKKY